MNVYVPIIIVGVLVVITLLLILADKLIGSSGEKVLTVNKDTKIPVTDDDTLLNTLSKEKIFIPSACGGKATCGLCKVKVCLLYTSDAADE